MLVWKGMGILVFIITIVIAIIMQLVVDQLFGVGTYKTATWPIPVAIAISGIIVGWLGYILNNKPGRILVDPETNESIEFKKEHSLFWIPMQFWGIILLVASVVLFFVH
ncbi:MAG TPA: hypothetical protein ENJ60_13000 [Aeromonadales bacterium]|nr:hypothetical protein [Aeromonadales bacterium]